MIKFYDKISVQGELWKAIIILSLDFKPRIINNWLILNLDL